MALTQELAIYLVGARAKEARPCKWRQILSNHTTTQPKTGQGSPLTSLASCSKEEKVWDGTKLVGFKFTINAGNAFLPGDGIAWHIEREAPTKGEAHEWCFLQGVALLLLIDARRFRLLNKDWAENDANQVAQRGHAMIHDWLYHKGLHQRDANGTLFFHAMEPGEWEARAGGEATRQITLQHSTEGVAQSAFIPPLHGDEDFEEVDEQIREKIRFMLDRHNALNRPGPVKLNKAINGKQLGPQLGALLQKGTLRTWLRHEDEFVIKDLPDGSWGVQYAPPDAVQEKSQMLVENQSTYEAASSSGLVRK